MEAPVSLVIRAMTSHIIQLPENSTAHSKRKTIKKVNNSSMLQLCEEKKMATYSSILAQKMMWTEEPSGLLSIRLHRVRHESDLACLHALEKEMATHSSILACRIPGTEEPGGLLSMGSHRVRHDCSDLPAAAAALQL